MGKQWARWPRSCNALHSIVSTFSDESGNLQPIDFKAHKSLKWGENRIVYSFYTSISSTALTILIIYIVKRQFFVHNYRCKRIGQ